MNHIEVWQIEDETEIEETINNYCHRYGIDPISISVSYSAKKDLWVVVAVCKRVEE